MRTQYISAAPLGSKARQEHADDNQDSLFHFAILWSEHIMLFERIVQEIPFMSSR
jgi:hypothetical protein